MLATMRGEAAIAGAQEEDSRKRNSKGWKDAALHLRSLHARRWNSSACKDSTVMQKNREAWKDRDLHDEDLMDLSRVLDDCALYQLDQAGEGNALRLVFDVEADSECWELVNVVKRKATQEAAGSLLAA